MRQFWDERARENAYFFVDNRLDYRDPDLQLFWRLGESDLERLLTAVDQQLDPGDEVVEIGCGVGRLTRVLATRSKHVTALDISSEMLEVARENLREVDNVTFVHGDGTTLSGIRDGTADACVSHVVFQHIPDPDMILGYVSEMGRVLKTGGWAAFQVSNTPAPHRPRWGRLLRAPLVLVGRAPRGEADPAWLGSMVDLDQMAETAGSAAIDVERIVGRGEQFCAVLLRKRTASA
jgi:SAM-dependent methyltransferase